jgi:transposase-like protein
MIGYSRQTTNYTIKDFKEGGFREALFDKPNKNDVFTTEVKRDLKEIWYSNPFLKIEEVVDILKKLHPHLKDNTISSNHLYYHINQGGDFAEYRRYLKKNFKLNEKGVLEGESGVLIEDLLGLLDLREDNGEQKRAFEKVKCIFSLDNISEKVKKIKENVKKKFEKVKWNCEIHFEAVYFYFQTNCAIRTVGEYLNMSSASVYRSIAKLGELEEEIAGEIGINKEIRVIGIDEKWIEIKGEWKYLFISIDSLSGDVLYLNVYESRSDDVIELFLRGLKKRGYSPAFIVTDLLEGYTRLIPKVFKRTKHVHCLIHFLMNLKKHFKDIYGDSWNERDKEPNKMYRQMRDIFRCKSPKTARKRYWEAMQLEKVHPEAEKIFKYLRKHFRHMMYTLEYEDVPRTNNGTERVIKRFARQIKNCGGFESINSARLYFKAFQVVYRLTPFRKDNKNKAIRGKTPVEVSFEKITVKNQKCQLRA